ncbi:MAG: DUF502 domain-containing protein [Deltaproteobacteria bacterium]|nr:DUF502 domain-containing protein [Deltaproteobacteria bacterium]MBW2255902.1 DUF502 domain-containing protein [Deltaproteobacteria bacterium]
MRILSKLGEILLAGLLALLPIYLTIQVLIWVFGFVDTQVGGIVEPLFGRHIPGTGLVLTVLVVFVMGILTRWWLTSRIIYFTESLTMRIPGLGKLYGAIKRLLDPLTREENRPFREAVWVPVSPQLKALGFITSGEIDTGDGDEEGMVSVFLPSCHPYFGVVTLARRSDLKPAPIHLDEALAYEFSFGAAAPPGVRVGARGASKPE